MRPVVMETKGNIDPPWLMSGLTATQKSACFQNLYPMASLSLTAYPKKPGKVWANSPCEAALGQLVTERLGITLHSKLSRPELKIGPLAPPE